jgi:cytochrome b6-f complex iron-sulfur subunit
MSIKRRDFIGYFGLGWLASCFPIALAACSSNTAASNTNAGSTTSSSPNSGSTGTVATTEGAQPTVSYETADSSPTADDKKAKPSADGFKPIGTVSDLDKNKQIKTKEVVVIRDTKNPKQLIAVSNKCTHEGCVVDWSADGKKFVCPCHGAEFDATGKTLGGPAPKPLKTYQAKIVGDKVLIKA